VQGVRRAESKRRVEEVAKLLRIDTCWSAPYLVFPAVNSQRVALGRALVRRAKAA